jgi:hypothetical protein
MNKWQGKHGLGAIHRVYFRRIIRIVDAWKLHAQCDSEVRADSEKVEGTEGARASRE